MKTVKIACTGADMADPADFKPLQGALKELSEEDYHRLKQLIIDFGFSDPVNAWDRDNQKFIISGHQRIATLLRMRAEGYIVPFIPYNLVDAENEHEAKMKVLGAASQFGKITTLGLRSMMDDLQLDISDVSESFALPGLDMPSLVAHESDSISDSESSVGDSDEKRIQVSAHTRAIGVTEEDESAAKLQVQAASGRVKSGDLWILGKHRLLCGDSTSVADIERLVGNQKCEMLFTDPPYGINYEGGHFVVRKREKLSGDEDAQIYTRFMPLVPKFVDGPCYTWFAFAKCRQVVEVVEAVEAVGELHSLIIWHKTNATYAAMNAQYKQRHEPCMYWKPKGSTLRWCGPTDEHTVWEMKRDGRNDLHPTQKPVALAARAIGNHTAQTVLDLFAGSGSTLIACETLERQCFAMELNEHYCNVILERWEAFTGKIAVLGK